MIVKASVQKNRDLSLQRCLIVMSRAAAADTVAIHSIAIDSTDVSPVRIGSVIAVSARIVNVSRSARSRKGCQGVIVMSSQCHAVMKGKLASSVPPEWIQKSRDRCTSLKAFEKLIYL